MIGVAELHRATPEVERHKSLDVVVELAHIAGSEEGRRTAVADIGSGGAVPRMVVVGEGTLAAVHLGYGEEVHMAAEAEGILVAEGMDYATKVGEVVVGAVGNPGRTGFAVHILPGRILEGLPQAHHSPAGVGSPGVDILEEGIGSAEADDILLGNSR